MQELRLEGLLSTFREHDKKRQEALEQLYAENKEKKEQLLQRFEELFKSNEEGAEFGSLYSTFTAIRDEWNALVQLDPKDASVLNRRFYELREQFYDLKAINDDLRQIDFKKNLEAKQEILAELRQLDSVKDTIAAYRRLQELTAQWHELGPVSKEHRQEINSEFKQLATAQHKRHQKFHDQRKATEEENLQAKERLCLQVEDMLASAPLSSHSAFNKAVEQIKALQEEWRKIGRAPRKDNESIYQRFRAGIDAFFRRRNEFFKANHEHAEEILQKKRELIERAAALKDSTDWEATATAETCSIATTSAGSKLASSPTRSAKQLTLLIASYWMPYTASSVAIVRSVASQVTVPHSATSKARVLRCRVSIAACSAT